MTYDDMDEVLDIEKTSFPSPWTRTMFIAELERKGISFNYIVRTKDAEVKTILGYIVFWYLGEEAQIANIATNPEYLKRGIGEKLMRFSLNKIRALGSKEVFLEVRMSNLPAQSLYKKLGFEVYGIRKKYYSETGEDAILMYKPLAGL
ncbi:MAG: ribosomal-protein-alanine N-acetyltransferase [Candidatus Schekmanbacteria bacterium RIFCSPHIGHO2_02_FULL_38_11]|uniref:[Ribosomal protein bS18]-alanine N-acetyltransferase n=1 Tax=Candidatus Schekmanbacteria bacterium RIFCSPLOWO2_12_FULL_38_15 TaxID=1817883 RepID=A0A1F7SJW9_9BACT|nr:MAG: ribosomal-protein-alanine N-acetyltransferase [Candidatus Schekmanbacteria bacterium GWA2_38_9]OGL51737.1 MAG: ribosomal-protein-alanine N-acetyltransferase [Candidatus Schekmanbacteria bacterium RIFCSPLOWO2_02_FULL_38_14]OGL52404.1 MAG: ribosomal-protein-alanine N-acetyltransferase [Candidatus Schekmanbacteria bacterium RIFCSPHIGHO2_02_FULL_38_11]OGL54060.1 MAG: ribosomal-protein-alanine N-acetyltransferase [Candidatus Schekmanbacteria bacterium RIFCSPLOWO2_12_FULL_38_15]